jgi:hypothetical protein
LSSVVIVSLRYVAFAASNIGFVYTTNCQCRLYCRYVYIRYVGLDDYFMVAALAVAIGMTIMNVFHVSWGTGYGLLQGQVQRTQLTAAVNILWT